MPETPPAGAIEWLNRTSKKVNGLSAEIAVASPANDVAEFLSSAAAQGLRIADLTLKSPNLESVFLQLTGRELRE